MIDQLSRFFTKLIAVFAISLALITSSYALSLTSSGSRSSFKTFANGNDLVCQSDEGEMDVDASIDPADGTTVRFVMESPVSSDDINKRVSHTCCEVKHGSTLSVADCETDDPTRPGDCGACGEFTLDQMVEDDVQNTNDIDGDSDPALSNCLEVDDTINGLLTYRCQVSKGAPKENWVWHLIPTVDDADKFCDTTACSGSCGAAMGTTSNAKPGDHPDGVVWEYNEYKSSTGEILLADFNGNWCHTGSFCLDDEIQCFVKKAKAPLLTNSTAGYIKIEVDTVNTFNADSTSGKTTTDLFSLVADDDELLDDELLVDVLVDATLINTDSITINGHPVAVLSSSTSDHNDDGISDLRTHLSTADFQYALVGEVDCTDDAEIAVLFKGTLSDPESPSTPEQIWIAETTVKVVCH